jgi:hypothetical protein
LVDLQTSHSPVEKQNPSRAGVQGIKLASWAPDLPRGADRNPKAASGRGDVQSRMVQALSIHAREKCRTWNIKTTPVFCRPQLFFYLYDLYRLNAPFWPISGVEGNFPDISTSWHIDMSRPGDIAC